MDITGWEALPSSAGNAFDYHRIMTYSCLPTVKGMHIISVSETYIQGISDT